MSNFLFLNLSSGYSNILYASSSVLLTFESILFYSFPSSDLSFSGFFLKSAYLCSNSLGYEILALVLFSALLYRLSIKTLLKGLGSPIYSAI